MTGAAAVMDDRHETFDVVVDDAEQRTEVVEVRTRGLRAADYYATNLELTGQTNWFGSLNLANMVAQAGGRHGGHARHPCWASAARGAYRRR